MKILLAGSYNWDIYEPCCSRVLRQLGHEVVEFQWKDRFRSFLGKIEQHFTISLAVSKRLNDDLVEMTLNHKPDVVFIWAGTQVLPQTLTLLKMQSKAFLVSYNNDDPYGPLYTQFSRFKLRRPWSFLKMCIPFYDLHFVYRKVNLDDFRKDRAKRVELLLPYFRPDVDKPRLLTLEELAKYRSDMVFIGHYEPDVRLDCLKKIVHEGLEIKLFGTGWTKKVLPKALRHLHPVLPLRNEEYSKALCAAKIGLAFFSKLNRDTYTRRTFEIPASGTAMLSEYSQDVASLFDENKEAVFFKSPDDLLEKAKWLLSDDNRRSLIAFSGRERCIKDGHDVVSRIKNVVDLIEKWM